MTTTPWPSISEYTEAQHCPRCGIDRLGRRSEGTLRTGWPTEHGRRRRSQHRGLSCEGERPGAEERS